MTKCSKARAATSVAAETCIHGRLACAFVKLRFTRLRYANPFFRDLLMTLDQRCRYSLSLAFCAENAALARRAPPPCSLRSRLRWSGIVSAILQQSRVYYKYSRLLRYLQQVFFPASMTPVFRTAEPETTHPSGDALFLFSSPAHHTFPFDGREELAMGAGDGGPLKNFSVIR